MSLIPATSSDISSVLLWVRVGILISDIYIVSRPTIDPRILWKYWSIRDLELFYLRFTTQLKLPFVENCNFDSLMPTLSPSKSFRGPPHFWTRFPPPPAINNDQVFLVQALSVKLFPLGVQKDTQTGPFVFPSTTDEGVNNLRNMAWIRRPDTTLHPFPKF